MNQASSAAVPTGTVSPSRYRATLIAAALGVLVAQVAYSLPGALNGTFQQEFNINGAELTWITAAFATAMVIFELSFGVIGDMFGRKQLLLGGSGLVIIGSIFTMNADAVSTMWIGQAIAGIGAGALYPISLTMIAAIAPNAQARTKAIALWAGFLSIGAAVAPIVAGAFEKWGDWRDGYFVVIGIALVAMIAGLKAQDSSSPEGRKLDIPGQITMALGLIALLFALTQGSVDGFLATHIVIGYVVAVLSLAAFVIIELRTESPVLELGLFKNRAFAISGIVAVTGMFAFLGTCYSMSIWLGAVQHEEALKIGLLFLAIQGPAFVLVPLISKLLSTVSPRWILSGGFVLIAVAGIWCSTFDVNSVGWTDFIAPLLFLGLGFALTVASITEVAINTVTGHLAGMASATTNLLRDLGFALGPVIVGAVITAGANSRLNDGLGAALGSATDLTEPQLGAAAGIASEGGALAINSLPVIPVPLDPSQAPGPDNPLPPMPQGLSDLAYNALGQAGSTGFLVCGIAALASAALTLFITSGRTAAGEGAEQGQEFAKA